MTQCVMHIRRPTIESALALALTSLSASETSLSYATGPALLTRAGSVFDSEKDLLLYRPRWISRLTWYSVLRSYYNGTFYSDWPGLRDQLKLYGGIRQIFSPLRRAVRVDVAKVPGHWTIAPGVTPDVQTAVMQIRAWSDSRVAYKRAVLHGAVAGEFGLLVVAEQDAVRIVPLRPDEVVIGVLSNGDPFGLVIKPNLVDREGRYEYAQLITPSFIREYRSGVLQSETRNKYGFVPLLLSPYQSGEGGIGENSFAGTHELLDRVNDAASQALDVVQRNAEPLTIFSGTGGVIQSSDNDNAIVLPQADAKAYTLTPNLAIDHTLALIETVLREFKNLLPQLILDDIRTHNNLAYDTVVTLLMELTDHIYSVRDNVDTAIETAERWAVTMASASGLVLPVDVSTHRIDAHRPVIQLTQEQQIALDAKKIALESQSLDFELKRQAAMTTMAVPPYVEETPEVQAEHSVQPEDTIV